MSEGDLFKELEATERELARVTRDRDAYRDVVVELQRRADSNEGPAIQAIRSERDETVMSCIKRELRITAEKDEEIRRLRADNTALAERLSETVAMLRELEADHLCDRCGALLEDTNDEKPAAT